MNTSSEQEQEPSVELRPLPAGWSWASLGELGLVRLGKTPRKSDYRDLGDHKIVKFRDVDEHGHVDWHNPVKGFVDSSLEVIRTLKDLQKNDVLVTASAHMSEHIGKKVGIVANIPSQFKGTYVVGEILQVRVREDIDPKWILYYLRSTDGYKAIQRRVHGVHLISSRAQNIEIPVAPHDQQKRIVAEIEKQFSRLDEGVANLKRAKANLKRYKAAVLKAAVEGRLVETEAERARREGRSYETGAQLLQRILETRRSQWNGKGKYKEPTAPDTTDLPELPEGWVWCNGAQLFSWSSGVNLPVKNLAGGDFPVYGGNGVNGWHTEANVTHPTLVIGRVGAGCGNVNVLNRKAWVTDNAIYAAWIPPDCNLSYLGVVFATANLNAVAAGSGQPFVNQTILNVVLVAMPPVAEQQIIMAEIERSFSIADEAESQIKANLQRGQRLRQSILTKAFTGGLQKADSTSKGWS